MDYILNRLRAIGKIETNQVYSGSHWSIVLHRGEKKHRFVTSERDWSSAGLPFNSLYNLLQSLGVSEQEFYERCLSAEKIARAC